MKDSLTDDSYPPHTRKSVHPRAAERGNPPGSTAQHWDDAYTQGDTTRGWYQPRASLSMELLTQSRVDHDAALLDVGAGASVFLDDLLEAGYTDVTALDHSPVALQIARQRLGKRSEGVNWIVSDLRTWVPSRCYDVWHDRAVAHFLLDDLDRERYRETLTAATHAGSWAIIGVFGPEGPPMCAGLPVRRHSVEDVGTLLGPDFTIMESLIADHIRPDGDSQQYLWALARRG